MNMMTPVTGPAPSTTIAVEPVRPVPPASGSTDTAARDERPSDERDERSSETTLRYKFDWLLQRQVSAGALSSDKAAEMIRLFDRTVAGPGAEQEEEQGDEEQAIASADPSADTRTSPSGEEKIGGIDPAAALIDRLRTQFATDGPYDGTGAPSASMPVGLVLNDRA